ncbi:hypothetical protein [Spirosoma knui]
MAATISKQYSLQKALIQLIMSRFCSIVILGVALLGCRETSVPVPAAQSTEPIARIWERVLTKSVALTPSQADTLQFVQLADGYHAVNHGMDSWFTYDQSGRLITQRIDGYRYGEGLEMKQQTYTYHYSSEMLTMTRESVSKNRSGPYSKSTQQIPVDAQGHVAYSPQIYPFFYWTDTGLSALFRNVLLAFAGDTLRTYDADGFITRIQQVSQSSSNGFRVSQVQEVSDGNVIQTRKIRESLNLLNPSASPPEVLESNQYEFDKSRPGLRNPYPFLGNTNRNLVVRSVTTAGNGTPLYSEEYRYEYDTKGRVKRYFITNEGYIIVGDIDYVNS